MGQWAGWIRRGIGRQGHGPAHSGLAALGAVLVLAGLAALVGPVRAIAGPASAPPAQSTTFASTFTVSGLVGTPRSFSLDNLAALPQVTLPVTFGSGSGVETGVFTGPRLLDVLDAAGGPQFPPGRNTKLRTYVLATGADGYQAIIAWGELDPDFGAQPVLVAWQRDGQPLGEGQGIARLVVPADKRGGRHVATIARLELRDSAAPTPAVAAISPVAPLLAAGSGK